MSWSGIRGIGSIYYLMHVIGYGVESDVSRQLVSMTLWVIAVSVVIHGIFIDELVQIKVTAASLELARRRPRPGGMMNDSGHRKLPLAANRTSTLRITNDADCEHVRSILPVSMAGLTKMLCG
jgi:hypothetical protein